MLNMLIHEQKHEFKKEYRSCPIENYPNKLIIET